jgi:hypothetical protein
VSASEGLETGCSPVSPRDSSRRQAVI